METPHNSNNNNNKTPYRNNINGNNKGVATRSENSNEIVSVPSYLRKTIVTIAFVDDFVQSGRVELYRLIALYCCILIG